MSEDASRLAVIAFLAELSDKRWLLRRLGEAKLAERRVALVVYTQDPVDVAEKVLQAACKALRTTAPELASDVVFVETSSGAEGRLEPEPVAVFSVFPQHGAHSCLPRFISGDFLGRYVGRLGDAEGQAFPPRPPDFVGVGVQKAGTTWWTKLLREHPKLEVPVKELHFFDGMSSTAVEDCPTELYARLFRRSTGALSGEFTPAYIFWPWIPPLLRAAAPSAKILVMLRDPVERYRSGLAQVSQMGHEVTDTVHEEHKRRGFYGEQLERLFEYFAKENVLVLQYEKCASETLHYYRETLRFLGLRNVSFRPASLNKKVNRSRIQKIELDPDSRQELVNAYRDDLARVAALVPEIDLALWKSLA
jgi:hypothetical protein